jgi:two-component system, OmpR family, response regulator RegX3
MTKILVVEDEESFREGVSFILSKEGYEVIDAADGNDAIIKFEREGADLVLLDVMLPGLSGLEVCKKLRTLTKVPIIMLTAKDTELDKVLGLEIGADDYITKPFSSRELLARVKAILRRTGNVDIKSAIMEIGPVRVDTERHTVSVEGVDQSLPLKEFDLLVYLMQNAGRVLTRTQLIDRIWGSDYFGDTKTLDVHVKRLRSRIEKDAANPKFIQTIRGLGYKFENVK